MHQAVTLMDSLRNATWSEHKKLEKRPFNQALAGGCLAQAAYVSQLQQYFLLLLVLEQALANSHHPSVQHVWQEDLRKTHLLQRDLLYFQALEPLHAVPANSLFMHWLEAIQHTEELALLGILYVFEGSTLGASVLLPIVQKSYALTQAGCAFYRAYGVDTRAHWAIFRERMNQAVLEPAQQHQVIQAAQQCFSQIAALLDDIWQQTNA